MVSFSLPQGTIHSTAGWASEFKDVNMTSSDDATRNLTSSEFLLAHMISQANMTLIMLIKVRLASELLFQIK